MRTCDRGSGSKLKLTYLPLAVACGALPMAAWAEPPAAEAVTAPTASATGDPIEIVTITAQRRREPAREVPLSVDVVKGEALERGGYQSLGDLAALLPGVNLNQAGGATGQSQITMRGVTTGSQVGATVSMYIDDVPFGSSSAYAGGGSSALDLGLFDLANVEVLRGPQGTLYGAGAMGGLIKYAAVEPDSGEFSVATTGELSRKQGGESGHVLRAVVNTPLKPGVAALRATLYQRADGGFIRDLNHPGGASDGSTTSGGRLAFLLTPNKDLSLRVTALSQRQRHDGSTAEDMNLATMQPVDGPDTMRRFISEPVDVGNDLVSMAIKADLKWATLDVISGWQRSTNHGRMDPSAFYVPLLGAAGINAAGYALDYSFYNRKLTQEVRLTSPRSKIFEWLAGAFYTSEEGSKNQHMDPLNAARQPVAPLLLDATFPSTFREAALFGTGTYYTGQQTDLSLGVRRSQNRQHLDNQLSGLFAPASQPAADSSEGVTTWLLTARWRPAARHALYARVASGYRPGGPLPVIRNPLTGEPLNKPAFRSDSLWSYELGWKGDLLPNLLASELALYQINWKNMQVFSGGGGFGGISNAGSARSRGLEWTLRSAPISGWRLSSALSVIDAKLLDASPDLGGKAGERLPDTARVSTALQADHEFQLGGRDAYVGATARYTGERFNTFSAAPGTPLYRMPGYATIDLRGGIEFEQFALSLFIRNLGDRRGQTAADTTLSSLGGPGRINLIAPRTFGLQLSKSFK
ncbi:pesticin receptor precursor [Duganella sp. HH101]|nr:pesticin receptor precursor [Duganella sp. HH101]